MKRLINFAALALFLGSCASAPPTNRERLNVVTDVATYRQQVAHDPDKQLVDLASLGVPLEIHYATDHNFMKRQLYPEAKAFLRAPAARALVEVQRELAPMGIGIMVWDAYRPYRVTEAMWEPIKNADYVADPAKGSRHNRGAAVDLTLISLQSGDTLEMPTPYDDFSTRAAHDYQDLPPKVLEHRALLRDVMVKHGFEPLPSEWWHYDFKGWERFELLDLPFAALAIDGQPVIGVPEGRQTVDGGKREARSHRKERTQRKPPRQGRQSVLCRPCRGGDPRRTQSGGGASRSPPATL